MIYAQQNLSDYLYYIDHWISVNCETFHYGTDILPSFLQNKLQYVQLTYTNHFVPQSLK